jgi:tRNA-(ms[2]io[6]A)-hydroxylase
MLDLRVATDPRWVDVVMGDFDAFLVDHAACERKASATGMSFVVRYPDRTELLEPMIAFAREELEHFEQVVRLVRARGLKLTSDTKDPYVSGLARHARNGREERLLDRLVMAGVVEARGCERFGLVARAQGEGELGCFYRDIVRSEARHVGLFLRLARLYFDEDQVRIATERWLDLEAQLVIDLELRPALH